MRDINVTRLVTDIEPSELSGSIAERGANAGPETWANAKAAATKQPLEISDRDGVREYFADFGAWSREEIAAWSDTELDALVLQYAAGDLRELQSLAPGDGLGGIDWALAAELAHEGTCAGNLYVSGPTDAEELFISLSD